MKKTAPSFLMALVTVLALATCGVAVAQSDMGNAATSGATFTVGIVDSFGDNSVTLKKDTGELVTIMLDNGTVGKANLVNGTRVRIDYRTDSGQVTAQEIEIHGQTKVAEAPVVEAPKVEVEASVAVETPAPAPAETYTAPAPAAPAVTEPAPMEETPEALPATASRMPTFALLGLLALGAGLAVRITR